ncbi:MAG: hypothetical protein ABI789_11615 [Usitatibacter sp.]
MRKLAPLFVMTSIVALAGGNALATTMAVDKTATTDKMGAPTVSPNTSNPQNLSYSDKSNTSPGTNAKMDGKPMGAMGDKPMGTMSDKTSNLGGSYAMDEDNKDGTSKMTKKKAKRTKMAHATKRMDVDGTMSTTPTANPASKNLPTSTTNGAAVNSTTGRSGGQ